MAPTTQPGSRRTDALSRDRIVAATTEILDTVGEGGLTVRALSAHLSTGRGALYHHVSGKDELLAAATDDLVGRAVADVPADEGPTVRLRMLALGVFDVIDAHPWVGTQLAREPLQPAVFRIWTSVGTELARLGVDGPALSDAGSALVGYVLGSAAQHAAGARRSSDGADRRAYLETLASAWTQADPDPVVRDAASRLTEHDDRQQFLAGVDIVLAGIAALR